MLVEEDLKAGRIPCLVATSSLELGHRHGRGRPRDPGRVAEVGRARPAADRPRRPRARTPSRRGASSRSSAPTCSSRRSSRGRCAAGEIEETRIPRNPLDVLAQQIVAIAADEEIAVDELHELVRRAYPFAELSRAQLENVLDMLAGRYPSDEFAELRPRIVWDRTGGTIRARDGARRLAVTNAGTIPDRGIFGVFLVDGGGRVGELDEEMVYEARAGQTFLLGASTWRIEEITRDRVLVSPGAGAAGRRAVLEGRGRRAARTSSARRSAPRRASCRRSSDEKALARLRERVPARRARGPEPAHVPPRAGRRDRRGADRPHDRRRALPRRDRRLARLHPLAVRRPRARAVGDGDHGAAARVARRRGAVDLVGRRDRAALPRRRRAAAGGRAAARRRTRSRTSSSPSSARRRSSARASARTPPARC